MSDDPRDEYPDDGFLRDSSSSLLGRVERRSDGSEWMTEFPENQLVGRYDPATNTTWGIDGSFVGYGNLLTMLLRRR